VLYALFTVQWYVIVSWATVSAVFCLVFHAVFAAFFVDGVM